MRSRLADWSTVPKFWQSIQGFRFCTGSIYHLLEVLPLIQCCVTAPLVITWRPVFVVCFLISATQTLHTDTPNCDATSAISINRRSEYKTILFVWKARHNGIQKIILHYIHLDFAAISQRITQTIKNEQMHKCNMPAIFRSHELPCCV